MHPGVAGLTEVLRQLIGEGVKIVHRRQHFRIPRLSNRRDQAETPGRNVELDGVGAAVAVRSALHTDANLASLDVGTPSTAVPGRGSRRKTPEMKQQRGADTCATRAHLQTAGPRHVDNIPLL